MAAVGIIACVAFVVSYSSRILLGLRAQAELVQAEAHLQALEAEQQEILELIAQAEEGAAVDDYARNERNWVKPGDQPVIAIPPRAAAEPAALPAATETAPPGPAPSHWRDWWALIAP